MPVKPGSYWNDVQVATFRKAMRTPNPSRRSQMLGSLKRR